MAGKTLVQQLADWEKKPEKTADDNKKILELKTKIAKAASKAAAKTPAVVVGATGGGEAPPPPTVKFKEEPNDFQDYQKFGELKFLQWKEDKFVRKCLKPKTLEQFDKLEKKFKDYAGKIPKVNKTVHIGIGTPNVRIVKGFGVPESLYKLFVEAETIQIDKYFE